MLQKINRQKILIEKSDLLGARNFNSIKINSSKVGDKIAILFQTCFTL